MKTQTLPAKISPRLSERINRLMPGGVPRYVRCYILPEEEGFDRYTVVFTGRAAKEKGCPGYPDDWPYVGLSGHGASKHRPCDVNRHGFAPAMGRTCHLGKRVPWAEMPEQLRRIALEDYREIWRLNPEGEQ